MAERYYEKIASAITEDSEVVTDPDSYTIYTRPRPRSCGGGDATRETRLSRCSETARVRSAEPEGTSITSIGSIITLLYARLFVFLKSTRAAVGCTR